MIMTPHTHSQLQEAPRMISSSQNDKQIVNIGNTFTQSRTHGSATSALVLFSLGHFTGTKQKVKSPLCWGRVRLEERRMSKVRIPESGVSKPAWWPGSPRSLLKIHMPRPTPHLLHVIPQGWGQITQLPQDTVCLQASGRSAQMGSD